MQTEAGKIQGAVWGWGSLTGYKSIYGNYRLGDPDGKIPLFGNEAYKSYVEKLVLVFIIFRQHKRIRSLNRQ